jgi:hypothetical protein
VKRQNGKTAKRQKDETVKNKKGKKGKTQKGQNLPIPITVKMSKNVSSDRLRIAR